MTLEPTIDMIERYRSDHLLVGGPRLDLHSPGVLDVAGDRVLWSGPAVDAPPRADAREHRLSGLLMPGFVNVHCHTPMVLLRGAGEGLPVSRWLNEVIWPREGKLTQEDVWWGMTLGAAELLRNGVTTSHEMYFFSESVAEAAAAAGLRCVVTPPVLVADDLTRFGTWEHQVETMVDQSRRWDAHPLVSFGFGPHSAYAVPEEPLRRIASLAAAEGMHIHIHVAEQEHEADHIVAERGTTVPRYLEELGVLESRVVAAHGIWLDDADIELLAAAGGGIAHCPLSNAKHASGIARVADLRDAGVVVGLATDGPASHDRLDMFEEMRWAVRLARLRSHDAAVLGPHDALVMATSEGAEVLGRNDLGVLDPGRKADMILIDSDGLVPVVDTRDLLTHIVYSGSPDSVRRVWVGGRTVVDGDDVLTVDVAEARRQATARARRLAS